MDNNSTVLHPEHYTAGEIECIDAIRASMGLEGFANYCKGNVIKYVWRWETKGGIQDLMKAQVYLAWMVEAAQAREAELDAYIEKLRQKREAEA